MDKIRSDKLIIRRHIFLLSIFVIILFILENMFLGSVTRTEGIKIGLYNAVIIFAIIEMKPKYGFILFAVKLIAGLFVAGNVFLYPLLGGLVSINSMLLASKLSDGQFGYIGIGIIGALTHNITVYVIAALSLSGLAIFYNTPSVLALSVIYGTITGALAYLLNKSRLIKPVYNINHLTEE